MTPTVTPEAVEAAAKVFWAGWDLDDEATEDRAHCLSEAERALTAAVPLLCQPLQDEIDRLRAEVARLEMAASTAAAAGAQDFATYLGRIADGVREQRS